MSKLDEGKELTFEKGAVIIREGEFDTCAYKIVSGHVEVYRNSGTNEVVLARLGPEQFFGEMNIVLEATRAASVRAVEPCTVRVITQDLFNQLLRSEPQSVFPLLRVLFERLRVMNAKYLQAIAALEKVSESVAQPAPRAQAAASQFRQSPVLVLVGLTEKAKSALGKSRVEIRGFPFRIGRKIEQAAADTLSYNDLYIDDVPPYNVSRNHCAFDMTPTGIYVIEDRGSTLGTIVNGQMIGGTTLKFEAFLTQPENTLILGGANSPYQFGVRVERRS